MYWMWVNWTQISMTSSVQSFSQKSNCPNYGGVISDHVHTLRFRSVTKPFYWLVVTVTSILTNRTTSFHFGIERYVRTWSRSISKRKLNNFLHWFHIPRPIYHQSVVHIKEEYSWLSLIRTSIFQIFLIRINSQSLSRWNPHKVIYIIWISL